MPEQSGTIRCSCVLFAVVVAFTARIAQAAELATRPASTPARSVEVVPPAVSLNTSQAKASGSCVLRASDGGELSVVSASASNPAIQVGLREETETATHVVTVTVPAGYSPVGDENEEIIIRTDLSKEPTRIPVRVWSGTVAPPQLGWLTTLKKLIGQAPPAINLQDRAGTPVEYSAVPGEVCVLMFVVDHCGHCNLKVPILERVRRDYSERQIPNLRFLAVCPAPGTGEKAEAAIERWDLGGQIALDRDSKVVQRYGVHAFPVVFLIGLDGTVQAVHGRYSNTEDHNGLDALESDLHTEIDILLAGGTRDYFPVPAPATQPARYEPAPLPDHDEVLIPDSLRQIRLDAVTMPDEPLPYW